MNFNEEKFLAEWFAKLPQKKLEISGKEKIWLKIQNYLREHRSEKPLATVLRVGFWPVFRFRKLAFSTLILLIALGLVGGATKASQGSLPGETLYAVKKVTEKVEQVLAQSDEAKVKVGIKHAKRRLEEVKILVQEKRAENVVTKTLEDLKSTTEQVLMVAAESKPELIDHVVNLVTAEGEVLDSVKNQVSGEIKEAMEEILTVSQESVSKLKGEEVKGAAAIEDTGKATSTMPTLAPPAPRQPKLPDGIIESPIQIHDVIKIDEPVTVEPEEPKILTEPTIKF